MEDIKRAAATASHSITITAAVDPRLEICTILTAVLGDDRTEGYGLRAHDESWNYRLCQELRPPSAGLTPADPYMIWRLPHAVPLDALRGMVRALNEVLAEAERAGWLAKANSGESNRSDSGNSDDSLAPLPPLPPSTNSALTS